jgi:hypothetical protein
VGGWLGGWGGRTPRNLQLTIAALSYIYIYIYRERDIVAIYCNVLSVCVSCPICLHLVDCIVEYCLVQQFFIFVYLCCPCIVLFLDCVPVLYLILYCIVFCIVLYFVLYCIEFCIVFCFVLYCIPLYCILL